MLNKNVLNRWVNNRIHIHIHRSNHHFPWFRNSYTKLLCGKEHTWKEHTKSKSRWESSQPSEHSQRQFIPTNLSSLAVSWWRKLPPVGSPSLCGPYINKATLPLDEFLVLQEKWYSFSLKDKQSFSRQALYMSFRQNTAMININTVLLRW